MNNYRYIVTERDADSDVVVSVTPLTGDPNIIVSYDYANLFPTPEDPASYDQISDTVGSDSITIKSSQRLQKNPSCTPNAKALIGSRPCQLFIAAYC